MPFQYYTASELWTDEYTSREIEEGNFIVRDLYSDVSGSSYYSQSEEMAVVLKNYVICNSNSFNLDC